MATFVLCHILEFRQDFCLPSSKKYGSRFFCSERTVQWHKYTSFIQVFNAKDTGNLSPVYNSFSFVDFLFVSCSVISSDGHP